MKAKQWFKTMLARVPFEGRVLDFPHFEEGFFCSSPDGSELGYDGLLSNFSGNADVFGIRPELIKWSRSRDVYFANPLNHPELQSIRVRTFLAGADQSMACIIVSLDPSNALKESIIVSENFGFSSREVRESELVEFVCDSLDTIPSFSLEKVKTSMPILPATIVNNKLRGDYLRLSVDAITDLSPLGDFQFQSNGLDDVLPSRRLVELEWAGSQIVETKRVETLSRIQDVLEGRVRLLPKNDRKSVHINKSLALRVSDHSEKLLSPLR